MTTLTTLQSSHKKLAIWLNTKALHLWWDIGADKVNGGFFETVALDGTTTTADRRSRVQPRQAYCYAEAGRRGWDGDWEKAVDHAWNYFQEVYQLENGYYGAVSDNNGKLLDDTFDLYNHSFALFCLSQMAMAHPSRKDGLAEQASKLLKQLKRDYGHETIGFEESIPRSVPLKSNPHMHMFEAMLAWADIDSAYKDQFIAIRDEIAILCMTRFIDAETGALREFFNQNWTPFSGDEGRVVEPGHQLEWAWLLARWSQKTGNAEALAKAKHLFELGEVHGYCENRKVIIMAVDDTFKSLVPLARLWPQTEWIKSAILLASMTEGDEREKYLTSVERAIHAFEVFLDVPTEGMWRDKLPESGEFIEEAAPASSFYHIACAIWELGDLIEKMEASN